VAAHRPDPRECGLLVNATRYVPDAGSIQSEVPVYSRVAEAGGSEELVHPGGVGGAMVPAEAALDPSVGDSVGGAIISATEAEDSTRGALELAP